MSRLSTEAMLADATCPFKQIASSDEALLDILKGTFSAGGCPFAKGPDGNTKGADGDAMLLKVLEAMPEGELPRLKQLLSRNASILQKQLGIDGGSWDTVIIGTKPAKPLAKMLKEGTKAVHAAAEKTHFVREFIKGRCERSAYAMMIKDLFFVYSALEAAAERCAADPCFGPLHFPLQLGRTAALEADMRVLFGDQWRADPRCVPSAAARAYVSRLSEVAEHSPALLVAHSYTRYLGDLSGGRVLMRIAKRMLQLPDACHDGVRFYVFEHVADPKAFKTRYRQVRPRGAPELQLPDDALSTPCHTLSLAAWPVAPTRSWTASPCRRAWPRGSSQRRMRPSSSTSGCSWSSIDSTATPLPTATGTPATARRRTRRRRSACMRVTTTTRRPCGSPHSDPRPRRARPSRRRGSPPPPPPAAPLRSMPRSRATQPSRVSALPPPSASVSAAHPSLG